MNWRSRTLARNFADVLVLLAAAAFVVLSLRGFSNEMLAPGEAQVIDGDSLRLNGEGIRLFGIDAPEYRQTCRDKLDIEWPCGKEAADALRNLVTGKPVRCIAVDADRYGRSVAECTQGARDLNGEMTRLGWAIAYRSHSLAYLNEEAEARRARRGIWRGSFENPQRWRARHRLFQGMD